MITLTLIVHPCERPEFLNHYPEVAYAKCIFYAGPLAGTFYAPMQWVAMARRDLPKISEALGFGVFWDGEPPTPTVDSGDNKLVTLLGYLKYIPGLKGILGLGGD